MAWVRHGLTAAALAVLATAAGCLACNDIGCSGGLTWTAATEDQMPLRPGEYQLEIDLEGDRFTIACTVTGADDDRCEEAMRVSGARDFFVSASVGSVSTWAGPGFGMTLLASENVEQGVRGPTDVALTLRRDGAVVLEESYAVAYERDEDFFGDERCGF